MIGRFLAVCGWLAWQVGRPFRATSLRRLGTAPVILVAALLIVAAAVPVVRPMLDPQPEDATAQQLVDDAVTHPDGWVRLRGRLVSLEPSPTGDRGEFGLLVDEANALRAVVVRAVEPIEPAASAVVTGRVTAASVDGDAVVDNLPIEATVAGTPPQVLGDAIVALDPVAQPERVVPWPLAIPPALLALLLLAGARAGYPVFRRTTEIDVLAGPLAAGERVPAAYGGRIGPNVSSLADPAGVLLLVRQGPNGNVLTAQPLPEGGGTAPAPVTIGGGWTSGRIGAVHAVSETVPALIVRSELVDATFLFARAAERDRVAALISVER